MVLNEEGLKVFESRACSDPKPIHDELSKSGYELEKIGLECGSLIPLRNQRADKIHSHPVIDLTMEALFS